MSQIANYDPQTGEVMQTALASFEPDNAPLAVRLAKVELDQAISTAKAYPRTMTRVRDNISALVMLDEETAKECVYALPRGGKPIKGPSVRFAEIVASQYGNCKVGSRVVDVNRFEKYVEAEGVFIDLESGMQRTARIRRKISDKNGRVYNDDMIVVTGNAACAVALREAILKGVPKALWRRAYDEAEGVISGDIKTLAERRDGAIKAFATWGVTADQIFSCLDVGGMDEIGLDEIATLTAIFKAIKSEDQTVDDYFPAKAKAADGVEAAKGTAAKMAQIAGGASGKGRKNPEGAGHDKETAAETQAEPTEETGPAKAADGDEPKAEGTKTAEDPAEETAAEAGGASPEDIEKAYGRGTRARARGQREDAMPPDVARDEALKSSWLRGWNDGPAAEGDA